MKKIYLIILLVMGMSAVFGQQCPSGISPASGATGVSVKPLLTWNQSVPSNVMNYELFVIDAINNNTVIFFQTTSATSYNFTYHTLAPNKTYDWYVRPFYAAGALFPGSPQGSPTGCEVNKKRFTTGSLTCVTNISPSNGSVLQTITPTLSWNSSTGADLYDVYLGTTAINTTLITTVNTNSYTIPISNSLLPNTTYFWYVVPKNSITGFATGCNNNITSFTTGEFSCTTNNLPANNSTNQSVTPSLSWNANAVATSYDVYFGTVSIPTNIVANVTQPTYSIPASTNLLNNTTYYWYVVPKNGAVAAIGCESSVTSFTTAPLNCVSGISPVNGQTLLSSQINLTWNVTGATSYDVFVGTTNPPTTLVANVAINSYSFSNYSQNSTYYWYIQPKNGNVTASICTSNVMNFNTGSCVQNSLPPNGSTSLSQNNVRLEWFPFSGASNYDVFVNNVLLTNVTTSFYNLVTGTGSSYYWYVVPKNSTGEALGCPSNTFGFSTVNPLINSYGCNGLYNPLNGQTNVSLNPTLTWGNLALGANISQGHRLFFGTSPNSLTLLATLPVSTTTYPLVNLLPNTTYYWVIWNTTLSGGGACGAPSSFTTTVAPSCVPTNSVSCTPSNALLYGFANFQINGEASSSITVSNDIPICPANYYNNFNNSNVNLAIDKSYVANINVLAPNTFSSIWIDFNDNGNFEINECLINNFPSQLPFSNVSFHIPINAPLGVHRLRLRTASGNVNNPMLSCAIYNYGKTYDYKVTIVATGTPYAISEYTTSICRDVSFAIINSYNNNNYSNVGILDNQGKLLAFLNANGNELGLINSSSYINNTGVVRQTSNGTYYLDRNMTITPTTQPSSGNVNVRLYFTAAELAALQGVVPTATIGNLNVTKTNATCTPAFAGTGVFLPQISNGTVGSNFYIDVSTPSFSSFFIKNDLGVLPLSIEYFKGSKQQVANILDWKLQCDAGASITITLERSADGRAFSGLQTQTITDIMCANAFNYKDAAPPVGTNYYRLKMVTASGEIKYSTIVILLNKDKGFELISIAPNPLKDKALLTITSARAGKIDISVRDAVGKFIMKQTTALIAGSNNIDMNFEAIAAGTYLITAVNADGEIKTTRFVKY